MLVNYTVLLLSDQDLAARRARSLIWRNALGLIALRDVFFSFSLRRSATRVII